MSKTKITLVVPEQLQSELRLRVAKDGYGLRGKSKWVAEALEYLLAMNDFAKLVHYSEELHGFEKVETIVISTALKQALDSAILVTRQQFPTLEGVQSAIVRTAIMQRLLRG